MLFGRLFSSTCVRVCACMCVCVSIYGGREQKADGAPSCVVGDKMGCGVEHRSNGKRIVFFTHNSKSVSRRQHAHSHRLNATNLKESIAKLCALINIRCSVATRLVVTTNTTNRNTLRCSLDEVTKQSNYHGQFSFCTFFKRRSNCTQLQWRF